MSDGQSYHDYAYAERIGEMRQMSGDGAITQAPDPVGSSASTLARKKSEYRHHNAFRSLETVGSVALPDAIPLDKTDPTAVVLYMHLLRWAKQNGKHAFFVFTGDLQYETGLSRNRLARAREELCRLRLLVASEVPGKRGWWAFELRNPINGAALPVRAQVDYANVSDWVAEQFYQRIGGQSDTGAFGCPSCKRIDSVHVIFGKGTHRHGRWRCRKCRRYGGFQNYFAWSVGCEIGAAKWRADQMLEALAGEELTKDTADEAVQDGTPEEPVTP